MDVFVNIFFIDLKEKEVGKNLPGQKRVRQQVFISSC
ncbi:hypothetical protein SSUST3_2027 [Streptococcus suis ST3]|nr:hypothetical protein SSUST3_2027 [Streptococcus suis ST3]